MLDSGCVALGFVILSRPHGLLHCKHKGGSYLVASWVPQVTQCCHNGQFIGHGGVRRLDWPSCSWGYPFSQGPKVFPTPKTDPDPTCRRPLTQASLRVTVMCYGNGHSCRIRSSTMAVWASTPTGQMKHWLSMVTSRSWDRSCTLQICGPKSTCRR